MYKIYTPMSDVFGQNGQAFKATWVSNSGAVSRGSKLKSLAPEQIGIFAASEYCSKEESESLNTPNFKIHKRLILKQGLHPYESQKYPGITRHTKNARESVEFTAKDILSWTGIKADPKFLPEMVAIGYNGIDASKSLNAKLDAKPLHINIRLSGEPIKRFFHTNFINYRIVVPKELCVGDCECYDACGKVSCDLIADRILKSVREDNYLHPMKNGKMLQVPIRQFIKANKIKKCATTPAVGPLLDRKQKFSIAICDDGKSTIGKLGAAYPNLKIVKESREDSITTYSTWVDFVNAVNEVSTITVTTGATTADGTVTVSVNGVSLTTATIPTGATEGVVATAIKNVIGASATVVGAVVTITGVGPDTDTSIVSNTTGLSATAATTVQGSDAVTTPANFTLATHIQPLCDECTSCTGTYTKVDGIKTVQVRVSCGSTLPAGLTAGAIDVSLISSTLSGGDVYLIQHLATVTDATIEATFASCIDGVILGTSATQCVGSNITFSWKSCDECFISTKKFMLTLPDNDCTKGDSRLAELQAAYPELVISDLASGSCMHSYETTITSSNCLPAEDCDKEMGSFEYPTPASYQGFLWTEFKTPVTTPSCDVPAASVEPCCVCGVVFETAKWTSSSDECTFGWTTWHPNDDKPVRMQINIHELDYSDNPCDVTPTYHTVLQQLKVPVGAHGGFVQEKERNFLLHEGKAFEINPFASRNNGFILTAKEHLFYDQYVLRLKKPSFGASHIAANQESYDYMFYVPAGEGKELEGLINELVLSSGNPELRAVVL